MTTARKRAAGLRGNRAGGQVRAGSRPTHLFVSTMARERKAMYHRLKAMLVRKGLAVSGDA